MLTQWRSNLAISAAAVVNQVTLSLLCNNKACLKTSACTQKSGSVKLANCHMLSLHCCTTLRLCNSESALFAPNNICHREHDFNVQHLLCIVKKFFAISCNLAFRQWLELRQCAQDWKKPLSIGTFSTWGWSVVCTTKQAASVKETQLFASLVFVCLVLQRTLAPPLGGAKSYARCKSSFSGWSIGVITWTDVIFLWHKRAGSTSSQEMSMLPKESCLS